MKIDIQWKHKKISCNFCLITYPQLNIYLQSYNKFNFNRLYIYFRTWAYFYEITWKVMQTVEFTVKTFII